MVLLYSEVHTVSVLLRSVRSYSYYIEGSLDEKDWIRLVDHTRYLCRSWQNLRFPARVVRFVSALTALLLLLSVAAGVL